MKNMKKVFTGLVLVFVLFAVSACRAPAQAAADNTEISEGTDTACEITGYHSYTGSHSSMFLKEGDKIAVISPSALPSEEQRDAVMKGLKEWGYEPVEGKYACVKERTLENCLEDLQWALEDPSIKAVFCIRGGYGASQVMDIMPEGLIEKSEKLIIGFSDITVYHSAWTTAGLPSVQSSMSASFMGLPEECAGAEKELLKGNVPSYKCEGSSYDIPGEAEGILIGGNLSTFSSVIGTAYDCSKTDRPYVLFFEEVESNYENVHRYLTWMKHAGVLDNASGIVFGEWAYMDSYSETNSGTSRGGEFTSYADMISREFVKDLDIPVAFGFPAGHGDRNFPLLMGGQVRLDVGDDSFTLEWE